MLSITHKEFPMQKRWHLKYILLFYGFYSMAVANAYFSQELWRNPLNILSVLLALAVPTPAFVIYYLFQLRSHYFIFSETELQDRSGAIPYTNFINVYVYQTRFDKIYNVASVYLESSENIGGYLGKGYLGTGRFGRKFVIEGLDPQDAEKLRTIVREKINHAHGVKV